MSASEGTGYSQKPLAEKLGIKPDMDVVVIGAPAHFRSLLEPLPPGVHLQKQLLSNGRPFIHCFARDREDLDGRFESMKDALARDGILWISWPKGSSKLETDLNENTIREIGLSHGLVDVKVASIDADWSGLKFVYRLKDR